MKSLFILIPLALFANGCGDVDPLAEARSPIVIRQRVGQKFYLSKVDHDAPTMPDVTYTPDRMNFVINSVEEFQGVLACQPFTLRLEWGAGNTMNIVAHEPAAFSSGCPTAFPIDYPFNPSWTYSVEGQHIILKPLVGTWKLIFTQISL